MTSQKFSSPARKTAVATGSLNNMSHYLMAKKPGKLEERMP